MLECTNRTLLYAISPLHIMWMLKSGEKHLHFGWKLNHSSQRFSLQHRSSKCMLGLVMKLQVSLLLFLLPQFNSEGIHVRSEKWRCGKGKQENAFLNLSLKENSIGWKQAILAAIFNRKTRKCSLTDDLTLWTLEQLRDKLFSRCSWAQTCPWQWPRQPSHGDTTPATALDWRRDWSFEKENIPY